MTELLAFNAARLYVIKNEAKLSIFSDISISTLVKSVLNIYLMAANLQYLLV